MVQIPSNFSCHSEFQIIFVMAKSTNICVGTDDSGDFYKDVSQNNWREHAQGDKCPINWL